MNLKKDIIETCLISIRNNKTDLIDKSVTTNDMNPEGHNETIENNDKNIAYSVIRYNSRTQWNWSVNDPTVSSLSIGNEIPQNSIQINDDSS